MQIGAWFYHLDVVKKQKLFEKLNPFPQNSARAKIGPEKWAHATKHCQRQDWINLSKVKPSQNIMMQFQEMSFNPHSIFFQRNPLSHTRTNHHLSFTLVIQNSICNRNVLTDSRLKTVE